MNLFPVLLELYDFRSALHKEPLDQVDSFMNFLLCIRVLFLMEILETGSLHFSALSFACSSGHAVGTLINIGEGQRWPKLQ